jgi:hypothetical protein
MLIVQIIPNDALKRYEKRYIILSYILIKIICLKAYFVPITLVSPCEVTGSQGTGGSPDSSLSHRVRASSRMMGVTVSPEALIFLVTAGPHDTWNRGFTFFDPTNAFGGVGLSTPIGRHKGRPLTCRLTYALFCG